MKKCFCLAILLSFLGASESEAQSLATAYKGDNAVNPILPYNLCADPTAIEYNGRLYVYGTNDQLEYNTTKNATKNTYGKITQLVCFSTADMVNWTFHGPIDVKSASSWIATSWAPSIVSRKESDGKTHFYLYYTNTASGIGMLTATSPTGPWKDPLGRALIDWTTSGRGEQSNIIDPGVCIDANGDAWLSFGGGEPNKNGSKLMPGNARIVKLGKNMKSLDGPIVSIPAPFHFEANELNYINGKYVFSYSGGWSCNGTDWSKYQGRGSYACPANCSILSMTTDDPINGTWEYTGEILKNPGNYGYPWGNNHSHMQKFGDSYYMLYHTQYLEGKMGLSGGYRGIAINKVTVNESTAKITAPKMTTTGPSVISANCLKATDGVKIEAECMANCAGILATKFTSNTVVVSDVHAGDWTMVRGITFPDGAKSITLRIKGTGKLEVRPSKITAAPIATIEFKSTLLNDMTVDLAKAIPAGQTYSYLYFVFTEATGNILFDRYMFNTTSHEEETVIENVLEQSAISSAEYFDINGRRLNGCPNSGFYVVRQTLSDGRQKVVKRFVTK